MSLHSHNLKNHVSHFKKFSVHVTCRLVRSSSDDSCVLAVVVIDLGRKKTCIRLGPDPYGTGHFRSFEETYGSCTMDLRTCHDSRCHLEDRTQQYHPVAMRPDSKFLFAVLLLLTPAAFSAERLCNDTVSVRLSVCPVDRQQQRRAAGSLPRSSAANQIMVAVA